MTFAETEHQENIKQKRMTALSEFAGSMKETWKDIDALEYQKKLRDERTIGEEGFIDINPLIGGEITYK